MNILVIGMIGSGYKNIAQTIAERLDRKYIDTDEVLTRNLNISLQEIYSLITPASLSELLNRLCIQISCGDNYVVSVGDMILNDENAMLTLKHASYIVYLKRPIDDTVSSDLENDHPLLARGRTRLFELYIERENLFSKYATDIIDYYTDCENDVIALFNKYDNEHKNLAESLEEIDVELFSLLKKRGLSLYNSERAAEEYADKCLKQIEGVKL